jgi:hypothetical protein
MTAELVFESRSSFQVLRQDGAVESEPVISLQLELTAGPNIYADGSVIVNKAAWSMQIHRHSRARLDPTHQPGSMVYASEGNHGRCAIEVHQSPQRYAALLDMFRGGQVSEITVIVDGLTDKSDYSRSWDTAAVPSLVIRSVRFEFPLPQNEA